MPPDILNSRALFRWVYQRSGAAVIIWLSLITLLCSMPGQYIPSNNWLELLSVDKFVHASLFFVLALFLFIHALKRNAKPFVLVLCFLFATLYGVFMEIMQALVFSNRSADWQDAIANTLGATVALLLIGKLKNYRAKEV